MERIKEFAEQAGFAVYVWNENEFKKFAALVAAQEREVCADIAENWNSNGSPRVGVAAQIRARGTT